MLLQNKCHNGTSKRRVVNNPTQEISIPSVYVALYDSNNTFITMQPGLVSISSLKAGDDSLR
jgi:hypothetical protein